MTDPLHGSSTEQSAAVDLFAFTCRMSRGDAQMLLHRVAALYGAGESPVSIAVRLNAPARVTAEDAARRWAEQAARDEMARARECVTVARQLYRPAPVQRPLVGECATCGSAFPMNRIGKPRRYCEPCRLDRQRNRPR